MPATPPPESPEPPEPLPAGTVIDDRYRVEVVLGRGGYAITYRARDPNSYRIVIKELAPPDCVRSGLTIAPRVPTEIDKLQANREQTLGEAKTLRGFDSPRIVKVFDVFEANGTVYVAMKNCMQ